MKIYHYDHNTGEFVGSNDARIAPFREELSDADETKFLCPANATFVSPPDPIEGHVSAFVNGVWTQVEDHRGETWFAGYGQPVVIRDIGVPEGVTKIEPVAPPPPPPLTTAQKLATIGLTIDDLKQLLAGK